MSGPAERLLPNGPDRSILPAVRDVARALSRELGAGRLSGRRAGA